MKYFKKTMLVLAAAAVLCVTGMTSCSVKDNRQEEREGETSQAAVSNNCGQFVEYQNQVYYWKYNGSSFSDDALLASYRWIPYVGNQLVCRDEKGNETVVYTGRGSGKIVIYNGKLYIEGYDSQERYLIQRMNPDGTDMETVAENCTMLAVDENCGMLVYQNTGNDGADSCSFGVMDLSDGTSTVIAGEGQFLEFKDGIIYYEDETGIDEEERQKGTVALWKINPDGTGKTQLAVTESELYLQYDIYEDMSFSEIISFQLTDQYAYFTYGTYGGSGDFYQGGGLARVKTDGTGYQRINNEKDEDGWLKLVGENFIAVQEDGEELVYYEGFLDCFCTNMNTGETAGTNTVPRPVGTICLDDKANVVYYDGYSGTPTKLMKHDRYAGYTDALRNDETAEDEYYYNMRDMEIAGDWLYYTLEKSIHTPENDMGWRYSYKRELTVVYRYHIRTGESQELYRYEGS